MKQDIGAVAHRLAEDGRITDYDFWRALKNLDSEIYRISDDHQPIPIEMLRWRVILKQARHRRGRGCVASGKLLPEKCNRPGPGEISSLLVVASR